MKCSNLFIRAGAELWNESNRTQIVEGEIKIKSHSCARIKQIAKRERHKTLRFQSRHNIWIWWTTMRVMGALYDILLEARYSMWIYESCFINYDGDDEQKICKLYERNSIVLAKNLRYVWWCRTLSVSNSEW